MNLYRFSSFHHRSRWRTLLPLVVAVSACGDDGAGPDATPVPTTLSITPPGGPINVGSAVTLAATVLDQRGRPVDATIEWEGRDTTTVIVTESGGVQAIRMGEAWVVSRSEGLADSVLLDVRHALIPGEARVRIRGSDVAAMASLNTSAVFADYLGRDDEDYFVAVVPNQPFGADTALGIVLPGALSQGTTTLSEWDPDTLGLVENGRDFSEGTVWMSWEDPHDLGSLLLLMASEPSRIEVTVESTPTGPSEEPGFFTARVVSELRRYKGARRGREIHYVPLAGRDTLYADMRVEFVHYPIGNSTATLTGGPTPISWEGQEARWRAVGSTTPIHTLSLDGGPPSGTIHVPLGEVGQVPLGTTLIPYPVADRRGTVWVLNWASGHGPATSTGGLFEITHLVAPAGPLYGEVIGRARADLVGIDLASADSLSLELVLAFHAPVFPTGGGGAVSTTEPRAQFSHALKGLIPPIFRSFR